MPRIDLNVPFHEKDDAKRGGARWDAQKKVWYAPEGANLVALRRWIPAPQDINVRSRHYFILRTSKTCWKCDAPTEVFAFALPESHQTLEFDDDADDDAEGTWEQMDIAALPHYIEYLAGEVRNRIGALTPHYRVDFSQTTQSWYWMNHCQHCGVKQGDYELFCEPDVAFLPMTDENAEAIQIEEILEPFEALATGFSYDPEFLHGRW